MTSAKSILRAWVKSTMLVFCALGLALTLAAQTASTGTVQGRVYNPVSKEYVRNAEVRLGRAGG
jgi:hypothetical protein